MNPKEHHGFDFILAFTHYPQENVIPIQLGLNDVEQDDFPRAICTKCTFLFYQNFPLFFYFFFTISRLAQVGDVCDRGHAPQQTEALQTKARRPLQKTLSGAGALAIALYPLLLHHIVSYCTALHSVARYCMVFGKTRRPEILGVPTTVGAK